MINVKKHTAHSLQQTDKVGKAKANEAVVAGMIVSVDAAGDVVKGGDATSLFGFAINNQTDGDVVESGKIGVYLLDGGSVIETDQAAATITSSNYAIGAALYPEAGNTGKVTTDNTVGKVIGYVEGIRTLPNQNSSTFGTTKTVTVLGIKLAA